MTKKLLALEVPAHGDPAGVAYHNTFARYTAIKEQQAHLFLHGEFEAPFPIGFSEYTVSFKLKVIF
jgi:hypothetical protein